jgi:hypothetical protein
LKCYPPFIFTLGPEFETIQNNFRIGNLPEEWKTQDWAKLLVLCRDYSNSINPQGSSKKNTSQDSNFSSQADRMAHHKKIKLWFLNPMKYCKELESEQKKHGGKCIYHLSSTHATEDCHIKKDCDCQLAEKTSTPGVPISGTSGRLRNLKEDMPEADTEEELSENLPDMTTNDTNEDDLYYFARLTNHYLRLVKSSPSLSTTSRHLMQYPVIADSGANFHMFKEKEFFEYIKPFSGQVILGDGQTKVPIQGIGTVLCSVGEKILCIPNVRYVPDLAESIYSLFVHIKQPNHGLQSSFDHGLHIKFPSFLVQALLGSDDIYLPLKPHGYTSTNEESDTQFRIQDLSSETFCRNVTQPSITHTEDTKTFDNLLRSLQKYYTEVKTKRQLSLNVPAGFRQNTTLQKSFQEFLPPSRKSSAVPLDPDNLLNLTLASSTELLSHNSSSDQSPTITDPASSSVTNESSLAPVPILRCVDKPSSSLPSRLTLTEDFIRSSVGYRRIDTIKRYLPQLYQNTIKIDSSPPDAVHDMGEFATLPKQPRNTAPVIRPTKFGDVIHMDIVFGPEVALGNVHYGLLFTDRHSRMTYMYPLQNLTTDIIRQLEAFFPCRLISDFDTKLIGGKAREYMNSLKVHVNAAPLMRQDKNGLAERHWQTLTAMARNWLVSAELPSTFWFYAVKRAAEVSKYFPLKLDDGSWTTPIQLAHKIQPDLRVLFKLFSVVAVRRERVGDCQLSKFDSQSTLMIAVGHCSNSNSIQFYNPVNGTFVSSIDYKFQPNVTAGSQFGY